MEREPQPIVYQAGTEDEWLVTLLPEDGATLDPFDPGDAIACAVGQGPGLPALFSPTTAWIDATAGTIQLTITDALTSAIDPGVYPVDLFVTRAADAKRRRVWAGWLEIEPGAGSGTAGPVYGSYQDLLDFAGEWLPAIRPERTQANFLKARVRARAWLDTVILAHIPPTMATRGDLLYGLNLFGPTESYSRIIKGYLDSDFLIATEARREIVSRKAIAYACEDQIGNEDPDPWPARAALYHGKANNLVRGYIAEIDIDGDGQPDYAFNCGLMKLRRD